MTGIKLEEEGEEELEVDEKLGIIGFIIGGT